MYHHDGRRQELNARDEVSEGIITQSKQKGRDSKRDALNQKYLQCREDTIQHGRYDVNGLPGPLDEVVFVGHDTSVQQDIGHNQKDVQLVGRESQNSLEKFPPCRIANLQ